MSDDKQAETLSSGVTLGEEEKERDVENAGSNEAKKDFVPSMDGKKWGIIAGASVCGILVLNLILGMIVMIVVKEFYWDYTGYEYPYFWRFNQQAIIEEAVSTGSWGAVEDAVGTAYGWGPQGVAIIGDKDGAQVRSQQGSRIGFDKAFTVAELSVFLNMATAYAAMAKNDISPDLEIGEVLSYWPAGDKNTIYTMAAMTPGFDDAGQDRGCANKWQDGSGLTWDACMELAAEDVISADPGTSFYPGYRELMYAAGVTQTKLGQPRTHEGWEATMKEYLLDPAGVDTSVDDVVIGAGHMSDCPDWMYPCGNIWWGGPTGYGATDPSQYATLFPFFREGIRISPNALSKIQHAIMFGNVLGDLTAKFFEDATILANEKNRIDTEEVDWMSWPYCPQMGHYHYSQSGLWVECDAIADWYWNNDRPPFSPAKAEEMCRPNYGEVSLNGTSTNSTATVVTTSTATTTAGRRKLQGNVDATKNTPVPMIRSEWGYGSSGSWMWFDFTNGVYGLWGSNKYVDRVADIKVGFVASFFAAFLLWIPVVKMMHDTLRIMEL